MPGKKDGFPIYRPKYIPVHQPPRRLGRSSPSPPPDEPNPFC